MPASDGRLYAFKYVNGHPKNTAHGLLTVTAFGVLADVETGYPLLLSELTLTTALRTAATSALAARHMARAGSRVMALVGNGAQSEFQAMAFHHMLGIRELRLYDCDTAATAKLARQSGAAAAAGSAVVRCASIAAAVSGADIVTTVTADKRNATILTPELIAPGMHLNAVGGDCPGKTELHRDILLRPDARVVVEFEPQSRIEGEIQQLPASFPVMELSEVLARRATARRSERDVTIFDSVGFALEDFSSLRYLLRIHREARGARQTIDLLPDLDDPKDLFALLAPQCARADAAAGERMSAARCGDPHRRSHGRGCGRSRRLDGAGSAAGGRPRRRRCAPARLRGQRSRQPRRAGQSPGNRRSTATAICRRCMQWNRSVHDAVYQQLRGGTAAVLLGGDHSLSIGSISAVARHCREHARKLRVLWLDAHADFNTEVLSPSGNVHGMPVACLCGFGPAELTGIGGHTPAIEPAWVRQIGVRSVDAGREALRPRSRGWKCSTCAASTSWACARPWSRRLPVSMPIRICT